MKKNSDIDIIWEFQRRLLETYKKENLKCIEGLDGSFEINGENVLGSYLAAMRKGEKIYKPQVANEKPKFNYKNLLDDLKLLSDEILHFTGLACLYSKYLSSPLDNPVPFYGRTLYVNNQELPEKRFFMYANCAHEKLYNYWDRIGDLLASYFPEKIKPERVFFSKIDKFIPNEFHKNENVKWLIDFKQNEFTELNELRIRVVHYQNLDTTFRSEHLLHAKNKSQLKKLVGMRSELIPNLKSQIDLTLEGFQRTIRIMEYISDKILTDEVIEEKIKAVHNPV